jgi:hypothetical protein
MNHARYLLSLPERVVRSAAALAGGLIREIGDVTLPAALRRTRLYQALVGVGLRFMIEEVGQVQGTYPADGALGENFLLRRTAGHGLELIGILAFSVSPVWVMAALADLTGAGRQIIGEISDALKQEGLLDKDTKFESMDQLLDGLERGSAQAAVLLNTPPVNVPGLRKEWKSLREEAARIPAPALPSPDLVTRTWEGLKQESAAQGRSIFEISALVALSTVSRLPENLRKLSRAAARAARSTGQLFAAPLLEHYTVVLGEIHKEGYLAWWTREFRPYLRAAADQFSPEHRSWTERILNR